MEDWSWAQYILDKSDEELMEELYVSYYKEQYNHDPYGGFFSITNWSTVKGYRDEILDGVEVEHGLVKMMKENGTYESVRKVIEEEYKIVTKEEFIKDFKDEERR